MTCEDKLKYCRLNARKWALAAAVDLDANGVPAPGQPLVKVWRIIVPGILQDVPGAEHLEVNFGVEARELVRDDWQQVFRDRWTAAMLSLWRVATQDLTEKNMKRMEAMISSEGEKD